MIEEAKKEDVEAVYRLICNLEEEVFDKIKFIEIYKQNIENPDIQYYIYRKDNHCVGFISLYSKQLLHHNGKTGEIVELIIDDEYRNQRIGEMLLTHVENVAGELGLLEIEVSSNVKRTRAHSFYEKHGYIKNHYNLIKKIIE